MTRILIAGANGTNGRALTDELRKHGEVIPRALVRDTASVEFGDGVEIVEGDLADHQSLAAAFDGVGKAYIVTSIQPNTIDLFQNFFRAAKAADVTHIVKFSGLGSDVNSASEVIRQHGETDEALRDSGLPFTILRPNSFYQNMLGQAQAIAENGAFALPLGDAQQSLIDVRDIAEITAAILTTDGHIGKAYDLTGPESLSFHDIADILSAVRGAPVNYTPITPDQMEAALKEAGMPEWSAHALAEIQALFATGAYSDVLPDAERLLGRPPRSFRQFAEDHAELWRSTGEASLN
ncbi:SDR family oxidoreductase [uncultured Roseobacter sp.]|uniref:SDR family oxidoreductase n=1 Tax=uncultured Roseobacter sp. TaxID=114847 RepID=UPI0026126C6B|nr:SDR family oxidoreductase [uncultured Roseobacter sp.]